MAGGLGTRLGALTATRPKAMVEVCGRPFVDYQLALLASEGVEEAVLCVGHLGEQIEAHVGDGSRLGVRVRYSYDGERLLGIPGALKAADSLLAPWFFVVYGDGYLRPDYQAARAAFETSEAPAMMLVCRNRDPQHPNEIRVEDGVITVFDKSNAGPDFEFLNYGVTFMRRSVLASVPAGVPCTEDDLYGGLAARRLLRAYETAAPIIEIGRPQGLEAFERLVARGDVPAPAA